MSQTTTTGLDQLDRNSPLPSLTDLSGDDQLPSATKNPAFLSNLDPPLAELPAANPANFNSTTQEQYASNQIVESLGKKIAPSTAKTPAPFPSSKPPAMQQDSVVPVPLPDPTFAPIDLSLQAAKDHSSPIVSPFENRTPDELQEKAPILGTTSTSEETNDSYTQNSESDAHLIDAILPIVESSLEKALHAPKSGLFTYLEPMLRCLIRRAIAEQMQTSHHFHQFRTSEKLIWRMKALFSSQTYDDIVFEHTHRYQVEEVFLMRYNSLTLISYASHDPSRHTNPKKIRYDVSKLMGELKGADGELRKAFALPNKRTALTRLGQNCFMVAVIRGHTNTTVCADLDYTLKQIEKHFIKRIHEEGHHFIQIIQPLLEDCLLIQSPPAP